MTINFFVLVSTAFMIGLLGGVHCIGMCGGFACALNYAHADRQPRSQILYQVLYSLGRVSTYTLLGAVMGLFGTALQMGFGGLILRSMTAVLMILIGISIAGGWQVIRKIDALGMIVWQPISQLTRQLIPAKTPGMALMLGSVWGLLPCGLVYSALLYSLSSGNWLTSAALMLSFGLGTLPALLLVGTAMQSYQLFLQQAWFKRLAGLTLVGFGLLTIALLYWPTSGHHCH